MGLRNRQSVEYFFGTEQPWRDGDSLAFRIRAERLPGDPAGP